MDQILFIILIYSIPVLHGTRAQRNKFTIFHYLGRRNSRAKSARK